MKTFKVTPPKELSKIPLFLANATRNLLVVILKDIERNDYIGCVLYAHEMNGFFPDVGTIKYRGQTLDEVIAWFKDRKIYELESNSQIEAIVNV